MINNSNQEYAVFKRFLETIQTKTEKPTLLLHSCCGPCSSQVLSFLEPFFKITIFYYNPNIYPASEFTKRLETQQEIISKLGFDIPIIIGEYDYQVYEKAIDGYEDLPERSKRCYECYYFRMKKCQEVADEKNFDFFTTTLSISPYKNSLWINEIGQKVQKKSQYLYSDFKKENGYQKSIQLSKQYGLYRQDYCGCKFSILEHLERINKKRD